MDRTEKKVGGGEVRRATFTDLEATALQINFTRPVISALRHMLAGGLSECTCMGADRAERDLERALKSLDDLEGHIDAATGALSPEFSPKRSHRKGGIAETLATLSILQALAS